jgi:hypothetical protein
MMHLEEGSRLEPRKILLVEDDVENQLLMKDGSSLPTMEKKAFGLLDRAHRI